METILLTIAIPTYNRERFLDKCLKELSSQINDSNKNEIEVKIYDNDSKDNTESIVAKYIEKGYDIRYTKNSENVGADKNLANCFSNANGKYVWVLSDDDFVLPGYLFFILDKLRNNDFGIIYLNGIWYKDEYISNAAMPSKINYTVYKDPLRFVDNVNYWFTFISGNIINKKLFNNDINIGDFYSTNLVQLSWTLPVIFSGKDNLVIHDQVLACIEGNSGGYKLVEIFGKSLNNVFDKLSVKNLINKKIKRIINKHLLKSFYPMFIFAPNEKFGEENVLIAMLPIYWSYSNFWISIFPKLFKKQFIK